MATMKAAITDGKGKLWLAEAPMPELGEYQCLCKILACATCTGTDQKIIADKLPWEQEYPGILGHESVGKVMEIGPKVRNISKGDILLRPAAVYQGEKLGEYYSLWGGFAEYGLVMDTKALKEDHPETEPNNYTKFQQRISPGFPISPPDASMLMMLKETASFVANVGVKLYASAVILGSGAVGFGMCRFSKIYGAYPVIVVGRRDEPLAYARKIGADFTINTKKENMVEKVKEITGNKGVDYVIDTTGDVDFLKEALGILSGDGKIAPYATYKTGDAIDKAFDQSKVIRTGPSEERAHQYLLDAVRLGFVNPSDFYSHRMPFGEIEKGFKLLKEKSAFKIVFEMG